MKIRRIVVRLEPRPAGLEALAQLAEELQAELLALFVENADLLHLAALPFAREVGFPSAIRRSLDSAAMERSLQALAAELRRACDAALGASSVKWSFRVARGSPAAALAAAAAESGAATLLVPSGADPRAAPVVVALPQLTEALLRELLEGKRPILIPEAGP
jgi:hypothetical protein